MSNKFLSSSTSTVTVSDNSKLSIDGSNPMIGPLNMGSNSIININDISCSGDLTLGGVNVQTRIDSKAPLIHNHTISQVSGLETALDVKASIVHEHNLTDIINLESSLNGKLNLSGGTMTGALNLGGFNISSAGDIGCQNLTVSGTNTIINTTNLSVSDSIVSVANNNTSSDTLDIGQYGTYNSGGVKYFSIFRDATDGIVKVCHGLTVQPSGTVINLTNAIYSNFLVGGLQCSSITLNGTALSCTASDLNELAGVTNGVVSANKFLICDGNKDLTGLNQLTMTSWLNNSVGINSSSSLGINTATDLILQKSTVTYATINDSGMSLKSNAPYTLTHDTNGASQDFLISKTGVNASRLRLYSDGANSDAILLNASSGGISLISNGNISFSPSNAHIVNNSGLQLSGLGVNNSVGVLTGAISSAGVLTTMTNVISVINITSGSAGCVQLPYTGTLFNWQQVTLYNGTSNIIILGHKGSSSAGVLKCMWFQLFPNRSVDLIFDLSNTCWVLKHTPSNIYDFTPIRWTGDNILNLFLNSNIGTYKALINSNSSITTINGVSTFQNLATTALSGTNWAFTNTSGFSNYNGTTSLHLTDTESFKFSNFIVGSVSPILTFSGLTQGNYYQFCIYSLVWSNATTERSYKVVDNDTGKQITLNSEMFSNNATNAPGTILTYVFRQTNMGNRAFSFTNISNWHLYGFTLVDLGTSL